ncbi:GumC family protein [Paracoccus sp. R86501]|uniref:GumC family protein n=1 Tax=Paracoccus sp. R86501 TaxID=3101711 RepID=UPI00366F3C6E
MNDQFPTRIRTEGARARQAAAQDQGDGVAIEWTALFGLIRRRILPIAAITIGLTAASVPLIMAMPKEYVASTRLIMTQPDYLPRDEASDFNLETELERMTSRQNIQAVIDRLDLPQMPELAPAQPGLASRIVTQLRGWIGSPPPEAPKVVDRTQQRLNAFASRLGVRREGAPDVVALAFMAGDPQRAADVANLTVQTYIDQRNDLQRDQLQTRLDWLRPRIVQQQQAYDDELARAREFQRRNRLTATPGGSASSQTVIALTSRRDQLEQQHASLTATLAMIPDTDRMPLVPLPGEPENLTALRDGLQEQQHALAERQAKYGTQYGGIDLTEERIATTRDQIRRGAEVYGTSVRAALEANQTDMDAVQAQLEQAQGGLSQRNVAELELADMLRSVAAEAEALARLQHQQRALREDADIPAIKVEVLSPATPPLGPQGRGRKVYLALTIVLAGFAALMAVGLSELLDRSTRSGDQLRLTGDTVPVGMLPRLRKREARNLTRLIRTSPEHPFSNALRSMLVMIQSQSRGTVPLSILVCPAGREGDATATASALALGLNGMGRRVLVVDCHPAAGLPEPAQHAPKDDGTMLRLVRLDDMGAAPTTPLEDRIRSLLDHGSYSDSVVIFDAPAALASGVTLQLAVMTARTLLVSTWGRTPRHLARLSAERLIAASDARVLMALVGVNLRRHARSGFRDAPLAAQLSQGQAGRSRVYPIG